MKIKTAHYQVFILFFSFNISLIAQKNDMIKNALLPFWQTKTMFNESVMMIETEKELPSAKLLFTPIKIISVKNSALSIEYKEGVDWEYKNGKLWLLKSSKAIFMSQKELYPDTSSHSFPKKGGGLILFNEGAFFHNKQLAVTYTHASSVWKGPIPTFQGKNLPITLSKLKNKTGLNLLLFGDSIAEGANASGVNNAPPYLPSWGALIAKGLKRHYKGEINFTNTAVGGKDSKWGLKTVQENVVDHNPDLVIIAFGMNDGTLNMNPKTFKENILGMINAVKQRNAKAEFILVSTMLANPESNFVGTQHLFKAELDDLIQKGIVIVDITGVHTELLKYKAYQDMTGNNINHPNDFLIRWYAQQILGVLII